MPTRVCKRCGESKPLTAFDKGAGCKGGRRATCRVCCGYHGESEAPPPPLRFERPLSGRRYIVTAAQNATPVHGPFWRTLQVAAAHLGAELVVIPFRYRNPTSLWSNRQETDEWWAKETVPHLYNVRHQLGPNLVLAADVKTQPTATSPLAGFEALTGGESCIIGHPKMQLRAIPVPSGRFPKLLTTTGACTERNYTDTKAGKIGEFHHFLGALVVELDGKRFHLRQLNADRTTGAFIDLDLEFTPEGVRRAPPALGLVMGDTHARFADPEVDRATFGPGGMVDVLQPGALVWHDVLDGYAVNPHHRDDPFIAQAKRLAQLGNIKEEVEHTVRFILERSRGRRAVLVDSNHGDFLRRWIIVNDWRRDSLNAAFYLETAAAMLRSVRVGPGGTEYADPWAYWVERLRGDADVRCLARGESFTLGDVECGMHGHDGPNGARGTVRNLSQIGSRVITGHGHSPAIEGGHYRTGTSTPRTLEYTHGPGSWLNTHVAVYANGRRALLTVIDGEWRLPPTRTPARRRAGPRSAA